LFGVGNLPEKVGRMDVLDEFLMLLINQFLSDQGAWLTCSLKKAKLISDYRGVLYGFEWPCHTALASYLLENRKNLRIQDIRIGQTYCGGRKYDILFKRGGKTIVIELKTIGPGHKSYAKSDVKKEFPANSIIYFLIISYPGKDEVQPLEGDVPIHSGPAGEGFKFYLYRKLTDSNESC
jgi:hypothetical protein